MALTLASWIPLHRSRNINPGTTVVTLPSGIPAWLITAAAGSFVEVDSIMHADYAGETMTVGVIWTVLTGGTGNLNLGMHWRRFIDGTTPSSPYSAQFGPGLVAVPAGYIPKLSTVTATQASTKPLTGGLGGIQASENFRLRLSRAVGSTNTAYIIGIHIWVP